MDCYSVLGVARSAQPEDIRKAYRKLAHAAHPDRCNGEAAAVAKFDQVAEAFTVLSSPKLRAIYDQYGEEGLRQGAPEGTDHYTEQFVFHGDSHKVFRDFFGTSNPYQSLFPSVDEFEFGPKPELTQQLRRSQDPAVERMLLLTLEEAFAGCVKKMKISRRVLNDDGQTTTVRDKILTINVKPGWKEGTRITFPKEGDQGPNSIPADIVFVIKYKSHPRFVRQGMDLIHTANITLADALCGCIVELLTLDGRKLSIPINDIIRHDYSKRVPAEGMPLSKDPARRGDLLLKFNTAFPSSLSEDRKAKIRDALGN